MLEEPHGRGDGAQGAEYWRREADRLQLVVNELREEVGALRAPITMVFQGVEDGVAYERSILRIPQERWESEVERFPYLDSWDWAATGGLYFLLSPVSMVGSPRRDPVARNN